MIPEKKTKMEQITYGLTFYTTISKQVLIINNPLINLQNSRIYTEDRSKDAYVKTVRKGNIPTLDQHNQVDQGAHGG